MPTENRREFSGSIHTHSEYSMLDSAATIKDILDRAKELGATTTALTDHGNMIGIFQFMDYAEKIGVNGVPGIEAYLDSGWSPEGKEQEVVLSHLILLSKDITGYHAICRAVSQVREGHPLTLDILRKEIGPGSAGHRHVFATSACVSGPLAQIILSSNLYEKEIKKLEKKRAKCADPNAKEFLDTSREFEESTKKLSSLKEQLTAAKKATPALLKKYEGRIKKLEAKGGTESEIAQVRAEMMSVVGMRDSIPALQKELADETAKNAALKKEVSAMSKTHGMWRDLTASIEKLRTLEKSPEECYAEAVKKAKELEEIFGKGYFCIELQYHGMPSEAKYYREAYRISQECQIPIVCSNDTHMVMKDENEALARNIQRYQRFYSLEEISASDRELYIKTDDELIAALSKILPEEVARKAMDNTARLLNSCHVDWKTEEHYPKFPLPAWESAEAALTKAAREGISRRFLPAEWTNEYESRLQYELGVINKMGYANYHLIVKDFINVGKLMGNMPYEALRYLEAHAEEMTYDAFMRFIMDNQKDSGYMVGPGRGSSAGSLVCYLIGITELDPIKYGLMFERFLNPERVSMPDIDTDFCPEIRDLVVTYLAKRYGENAVCRITTIGTSAAKQSVRTAAKYHGSKTKNDDKAFLDLGDRMARIVPETPGAKLDDFINDLENVTLRTGEKKDDVKKIIGYARLIENHVRSHGIHAAGTIISDNSNVADYVPLLYDEKKKKMKSQCDLHYFEDRGLLKMDLLGLTNLSYVTYTMRYVKKHYGRELDINNLPVEDAVFREIFSTGRTNGVFQFESDGMKQMLQQFKPSTFDDLVLLVAAYRPGPMQFLDNVIKVKHGVVKPSYITKELEPILKNTYSAIIYQEQVMEIFQKLAGYTFGQADVVRRAMSKKKADVIAAEEKFFIYGNPDKNIPGCIANGISEQAAKELYSQMTDFAKYAFNKSHAAAYAKVAYITAYLKLHYPEPYITAVMNFYDNTDKDEKRALLVREAMRLDIPVYGPDINRSSKEFTIEPVVKAGKDTGKVAIRFGLEAIKGVQQDAARFVAERRKAGDFRSFQEFIKRTAANKGSVEALIKAGAFDSLSPNRSALLDALPETISYLSKIKARRTILSNLYNDRKFGGGKYSATLALQRERLEQEIEKIQDSLEAQKAWENEEKNDEKEVKKEEKKAARGGKAAKPGYTQADLEEKRRVWEANVEESKTFAKKISETKEVIRLLEEKMISVVVPNTSENQTRKLECERDVLGTYVSSHPSDHYDIPEKAIHAGEAMEGKIKHATVFGVIRGLRIVPKNEKRGAMAFFQLEDRTGSIDVCCFDRAYRDCGELLHDGKCVTVTGEIGTNRRNGMFQLVMETISELSESKRVIVCEVPHIAYYIMKENVFTLYHREDGDGLKLQILTHGDTVDRIRNTGLVVSEEIMNEPELAEFGMRIVG